MSEPKVYTKKLSEFKPDIHNANKHTQRGRGMVERSQRERGFARPGFSANDGTILGGNLSLGEVGAEVFGVDSDVIVIETDGTKPIIHLRTDLDPDSPQAIQLALEDNRTAEVSLAWDADVLKDIGTRDDVDLGDWWFDNERDAITFEPPSLDDLADEYGEPNEKDFWPIIRLQVSPDVKERFDKAMTKYMGSDSDKLDALLSSIELS